MKRIFEMMEQVKKKMDHQAKIRRTMKELNSLSDYELNDIGINRGMIYDIAKENPAP